MSSPLSAALARLEEAARTAPYPLGPALSEVVDAWHGEDAPAAIAFDVCAAAGVLLRLAGAVALRGYVETAGAPDLALNRRVLEVLRAPADGSWLTLAAVLSQRAAQAGDGWAAALHRGLRRRPSSRRGAPSGVGALGDLVALRNRLVHGDPITQEDAERGVGLLAAAVGAVDSLVTARLAVRWGGRGLLLGAGGAAEGDVPPELPEGDPHLLATGLPPRSLLPLVCAEGDRSAPAPALAIAELFFLSSGTADRLTYVSLRGAEERDGAALGTWEGFRALLESIPAPPLPPEAIIDFGDLAREHARGVVGRAGALSSVLRFVAERPASYGAIAGPAGRGKTALLAHLHELARSGRRPASERWIFHFCMGERGRDNPVVALRSLVAQVAVLLEEDPSRWLSHEVDVLRERLPLLLERASSAVGPGGRLVLVVDALDEGRPPGGQTIGGCLPASLPPRVVGLLSWRVDERGSGTADSDLSHIPPAERRPIPGAFPLAGLDRDAVRALLAGMGDPTDDVEARVWALAAPDGTQAEPWILRLVTDAVSSGRTRLDQPESVPTSAAGALEALWLRLPADGDSLIHRLLLHLAVMRDLGDDAFFAALLAPKRPGALPLRARDVATLRAAAGKLLRVEGERYGLFHQRLRDWLLGAALPQAGPWRPRTVQRAHARLGELGERAGGTGGAMALRPYGLRHGAWHLVAAGEGERARAMLGSLEVAAARLALEPAVEAPRLLADCELAAGEAPPPAFDAVRRLWRDNAQVLGRRSSGEALLLVVVQAAITAGGEVAAEAERLVRDGAVEGLWLAPAGGADAAPGDGGTRPGDGGERPAHVEIGPLRTMDWPGAAVDGVVLLGDTLVGWSSDGPARTLSLETGCVVASLEGHLGPARGGAAVDPEHVVTWARDGAPRVFRVADGECCGVLGEPSEWALSDTAPVVLGGGIIATAEARAVTLWTAGGECVARVALSHHAGRLLPVPGGALALGEDGGATVVDRAGRVVVSTRIEAPQAQVRVLPGGSVAVCSFTGGAELRSPDLELRSRLPTEGLVIPRVLAAAADGSLVLDAGDDLALLWGGGEAVRLPHVAEGGARPVSGGLGLPDGRVATWSRGDLWLWARDGALVATRRAHANLVWGAAPVGDGGMLTWSFDGTLCLWGLEDLAPLATFAGHAGPVTGARVLPDGRVLSWGHDRTIRLWVPKGGSRRRFGSREERFLTATPEGVVLGHEPGRLLVRRADEPGRVCSVVVPPGRVSAFVGVGGPYVVAHDGEVLRLDPRTGDVVWRVGAGRFDVWGGAVEAGPTRLVVWPDPFGEAGPALLLDAETGRTVAPLDGHGASVRGAALVAEGVVATCAGDGSVRAWGAMDGQHLWSFQGPAAPHVCLRLSGGRLLLRPHEHETDDTRMHVLSASTGAVLATIPHGHRWGIAGALEGTGDALVTWTYDTLLRSSATSGRPPRRLGEHDLGVRGATLLADGRVLAWSADGAAVVWGGSGRTSLGPPPWKVGGATQVDGGFLLWPDTLVETEQLCLVDAGGDVRHSWTLVEAAHERPALVLAWLRATTPAATLGHAFAAVSGHSRRVLLAPDVRGGGALDWHLPATPASWPDVVLTRCGAVIGWHRGPPTVVHVRQGAELVRLPDAGAR